MSRAYRESFLGVYSSKTILPSLCPKVAKAWGPYTKGMSPVFSAPCGASQNRPGEVSLWAGVYTVEGAWGWPHLLQRFR